MSISSEFLFHLLYSFQLLKFLKNNFYVFDILY